MSRNVQASFPIKTMWLDKSLTQIHMKQIVNHRISKRYLVGTVSKTLNRNQRACSSEFCLWLGHFVFLYFFFPVRYITIWSYDQHSPLSHLQCSTFAVFSLSYEWLYRLPLLILPHQTCLLMNAEFLLSNQISSGYITFNIFWILFFSPLLILPSYQLIITTASQVFFPPP